MIILDAITKSLEIVLNGAVTTTQLPYLACYVDLTTTTYVPKQKDGTSNSTTAVTIVAAPAVSTQRQVKMLGVCNKDTVPAVVTVRYNNNGTLRRLIVVTLAVGSTLFYTDGEGWRVILTNGTIKAVGTVPGGSNTQVQFNDNGAFGGDPKFIWVTPILTVQGTLRLAGATSGYVGFAPAAVAGATTYTLPSADGSAGQALQTNGSAVLSWGSIVGGSDTQVQFNNAGVLAGASGFTYVPGTQVFSLPGLLNISAAAAGQIQFPATQNPSSNVQTLDDYEEGDWTVGIGGQGGQSGQAYTSRAGRYIKIGKVVIAGFSFILSTEGTLTGNCTITGLPFTAEAAGASLRLWIGGATPVNLATSWMSISVEVVPSDVIAYLRGMQAAQLSDLPLTAADITNTTQLQGTVIYEAAA